jgi:hypothetical protein
VQWCWGVDSGGEGLGWSVTADSKRGSCVGAVDVNDVGRVGVV